MTKSQEALFKSMQKLADHYGWEVTVRDPGPDEENCDMCAYYDAEGFMPPIHECPHDMSTEDMWPDTVAELLADEEDRMHETWMGSTHTAAQGQEIVDAYGSEDPAFKDRLKQTMDWIQRYHKELGAE